MYDEKTGFYYLRSRYYDPKIGRFLNGDLLISSEPINTNLFAYCKNNPIKHGDFNGLDAVILLSKETGGHIGLLLEDDEGNWYHFYWGADGFENFLCSLIPFNTVKLKVKFDKIQIDSAFNPKSLESINSHVDYAKKYEDMEYLVGDFSDSVDAANYRKMYCSSYVLLSRNCSNISFDILAQSDTKYRDAALAASKKIFPANALSKFRSIIFPKRTITPIVLPPIMPPRPPKFIFK